MKIGPYTVSLLTLGHFRMDGGGLFGIIPKKLWQRAYPYADDENRVLMAARALLIVGSGAVVLADSGLGDKLDDKTRSIFCLDQQPNALVAALRERGIATGDVTHFIYTHLHFDHAGGTTWRREDGEIIPTFPNAKHFIQAQHLSWARQPSDKDRASFLPVNWESVASAGLLEERDGEYELLSGITLVPVHGHTPAMQMVQVTDESTSFIYTIDLFPSAAHLPPHYVAAFDNYPLQTIDEKRSYLEQAIDSNSIICFGHDPELAAVRVQRSAKGFEIAERITADALNT